MAASTDVPVSQVYYLHELLFTLLPTINYLHNLLYLSLFLLSEISQHFAPSTCLALGIFIVSLDNEYECLES